MEVSYPFEREEKNKKNQIISLSEREKLTYRSSKQRRKEKRAKNYFLASLMCFDNNKVNLYAFNSE